MSADWTLIKVCADPSCKHDIDTHHERTYNCLAAKCECKYYRDKPPSKTEPYKTGRDAIRGQANKPHADTTCNCPACVDWVLERFLWA